MEKLEGEMGELFGPALCLAGVDGRKRVNGSLA